MGSVARAATFMEFERRLDLVLSDQDLICNFEADTQFLTIKHILFDDENAIVTKAEED